MFFERYRTYKKPDDVKPSPVCNSDCSVTIIATCPWGPKDIFAYAVFSVKKVPSWITQNSQIYCGICCTRQILDIPRQKICIHKCDFIGE
ncbi:unnamed protein product [Callosobruchus maculatus]|uniref:Uncharacterized protein n=1 Tax=Callosobruchus maculatus TaxID=64391 RepID=A0A653DK74_CALMS|nr:unnamed protein product [Callosobruchus maculatus]